MMAESGGNPNRVGYNCYMSQDRKTIYTQKVKGAISWVCPQGFKDKAWSKDGGLLQLNSVHITSQDIFNPETNIKLAYEVKQKQGWEAWTTYKTGAFKKFLE